MIRTFSRQLLLLLLLMAQVSISYGSSKIEEIRELPPEEQYRQLSLILMIAGGADPALLTAMEALQGASGDTSDAGSQLGPDDYKTPLIRIVDQQSMLTGAAYLLRFAQESEDEIKTRMATIEADSPILISMVDLATVTEDAIVIRNAIADAIAYSDLIGDPGMATHLQVYRNRTIRIRNVMEYESFNQELELLTAQAIDSVGGKLDAYQRMFDEEVDSKEFDRQFDAADYIQNRTDKFNEKAGILTEEIMKAVILQESEVDP